MKDFTTEKIGIDWRWVEKELLTKDRISPSQRTIRACARECLKKARSLARPLVSAKMKEITRLAPGHVEIEGGIIFSSKRLPRYLKGATRLYIFVATIGGDLETAATKSMTRGDVLRGYFLDKIGSLAAESLAENLERAMRKHHAGRGESVSMRFSPGYCDWPTEEQRMLQRAVDFSKAGVRLTEGCMMVPRKSVSAVVGIAPAGVFTKAHSPCVTCPLKDCDHRR
ncbi:MAG: hypothetical protein JW919_02535 [Candidatus Omnitrophica bacterium]|nr:hypothetical protein [Candidatus Omnitrophota bacterium]